MRRSSMSRAHPAPIGVGKGQRFPPRSSPASVASQGQPSSQGDDEHIAVAAAHQMWRNMVAPENVRTWQRDQLLMYHTLYGTGMSAPPGFRSDHDQVPVSRGDTEDLHSSPGASALLAGTALSRTEQMVTSSVTPTRAEPADGAGARAATPEAKGTPRDLLQRLASARGRQQAPWRSPVRVFRRTAPPKE